MLLTEEENKSVDTCKNFYLTSNQKMKNKTGIKHWQYFIYIVPVIVKMRKM